jgi:hypothetical protein
MSGSYLIATLQGGPQDGCKIAIRTHISKVTFQFVISATPPNGATYREFTYKRTAPDRFVFQGSSKDGRPVA